MRRIEEAIVQQRHRHHFRGGLGAEILLADTRHGHDDIVTHQNQIGAPGQLGILEPLDQRIEGDVDADHAFEEVAAMDRHQRRDQPTAADRILVGRRDDGATTRVVAVIRQVVEAVAGEVYTGREDVAGIGPRRYAEVAVVAGEPDLAQLGLRGEHVRHLGIHCREAHHLVVVLQIAGHQRGVIGAGATIVLGDVQGAVARAHVTL